MSNRHERRKARKVSKGDAIFVELARLWPAHPVYGLPVECYVCDTAHTASGVAYIKHKQSIAHEPICDACLASPARTSDEVMRRYLSNPDIKFKDGDKATTEEITALADKKDTTEH
jgi:hypothetical protein